METTILESTKKAKDNEHGWFAYIAIIHNIFWNRMLQQIVKLISSI